jgi:hypothetical protein
MRFLSGKFQGAGRVRRDLGILWVELNLRDFTHYTPTFPNTPKTPHVTLAWGIPQNKYDLGEEVSIYLDSECWSDRIQAIRCQLPEGIPFEGKIPHITLSWVDGAKPIESAEMLIRKHRSTPIQTSITGVITWEPLADSAIAWRIKVLEALQEHKSSNRAAKALGIGATTIRRMFDTLPVDHRDRVAYDALVGQNKGGRNWVR